MFWNYFDHVTKVKLFPSYSSGRIVSINRTVDHSFFSTGYDEYNHPRHGLRSARTEIYTVKFKCPLNFTFKNMKWKEPF